MSSFSRDKKKLLVNPVRCSKCGSSEGTMVRIGEGDEAHYEHQDKDFCRQMQIRKK